MAGGKLRKIQPGKVGFETIRLGKVWKKNVARRCTLHGNLRYWVSLNKALLGPYFLGGGWLWGGYLRFPRTLHINLHSYVFMFTHTHI